MPARAECKASWVKKIRELPTTLFMTIRPRTLTTLVVIHLETTFLF